MRGGMNFGLYCVWCRVVRCPRRYMICRLSLGVRIYRHAYAVPAGRDNASACRDESAAAAQVQNGSRPDSAEMSNDA